MNQINTGEHIINLIQTVARIEQEINGISKNIKKVNDLDYRMGKVEEALREKKIITDHHKNIFNFFSKNWKFLSMLILLIGTIGGLVDFAWNTSSPKQDKIIQSLQRQVANVEKQVE